MQIPSDSKIHTFSMPNVTIQGVGRFDVPAGRRLVKAIEACGVDIGHRCGGKARCTTCRVRFITGEPGTMTQAEYDKLTERELLGKVRLSCQILTDHDMTVEPLMRVSEQGWSDPGPEPAEEIEPDPAWRVKSDLAA